MINHARTVLLNMTALPDFDSQAPLPPGEEFIPLDFAPLELPTTIKKVHAIIIPENATREQRNYLGFAFMQLAHTPEFEKYVLALDPRYTYSFENDHFLQTVFYEGQPVPLDFQTIANKMLAEIVRLSGQRQGLFSPVAGYETEMEELGRLWRSDPSLTNRLVASVLALIYRIDEIRRRRRV
jgi:hypothetical protein